MVLIDVHMYQILADIKRHAEETAKKTPPTTVKKRVRKPKVSSVECSSLYGGATDGTGRTRQGRRTAS